MAELLEAMSLNPAEELVVDNCHLYSSVPVLPLAAAELVNADGALPEQIVCTAAIVPPLVGLAQATVVIKAPETELVAVPHVPVTTQ